MIVSKLVGIFMGIHAVITNYEIWLQHIKRDDDKFQKGFFLLLNNKDWVCFERTSNYRIYYSTVSGQVLVVDNVGYTYLDNMDQYEAYQVDF